MSHRRSSNTSESFLFSWESKAGVPKEKQPRISWDIKPWASKAQRSRTSCGNSSRPWAWAASSEPRSSSDNKETRNPRVAPERDMLALLPPPPCRLESARRFSVHATQPPCMKGSPKKVGQTIRREDDPFLAAYLECTKSVKPAGGALAEDRRRRGGGGMGILSSCNCKASCGVRDDGMVRVSKQQLLLPIERSKGRRSSFFQV